MIHEASTALNSFKNLRIEQDRPGVMTVVMDMPGRPVNVADESLLRDMAALLEGLYRDRSLSLVIFRSGKESGFLAGADLNQLQQIGTQEEAETALRAGQELFTRVAELPMMTVAVIHGPCLGGGLEFALACKFRVARDDPSTRLGLPETQLGLIPGWGGTQRLPRLIGVEPALRMILEGRRLPASKAQKWGLVDMAAPPDQFENELRRFLTDRLAGKPVRRPRRSLPARLRDDTPAGRWVVFQMARRRMAGRGRQYPALAAAVNAIEMGFNRSLTAGLQVERDEFCRLLFTPTCRHLVELFFQRERARKPATWSGESGVAPQPIKTVAVIGAGTMGAGIAQLLAYEGVNVILKDIHQDLVKGGLDKIAKLMQDAVKAGSLSAAEADQRQRTITGTTEWDPVSRADLALEAVLERLDIKREVFRELDRRLPPEACIVSNTSALPIGELASATSRPSQVAGLHFFNPVHRMQLVEVVRSAATDDRTLGALVQLVHDLGKVPVVVADSPGFLVNRILFPYLDEAVRLVCEGVQANVVDREAEEFGMFMGPLELLDQVGIDIAADVAQSIAALSPEASPAPERLKAMAAQGKLGRKSNAGFYVYRKGRKRGVAEKARELQAAPQLPAARQFTTGESMSGIAQRLALAVINAAAQCLADQIVRDPWMVDLAMVLGTGFAPFRGGPLRLADEWGIGPVADALDQLSATCGCRFQPCALLTEMRRDHRRFYDADLSSRPSIPPVKESFRTPVGTS
jgi:3-hydroxyacyl-CoA dehydrogenase/enoyl-CoA hydratase/3-hydroxybutyryl-CoA epimerase